MRRCAMGKARRLRSCRFSRRSLTRRLTPSQRGQRRAIEEVLISRDRIQGLQGYAGVGKTTVLSAIREAAERNGYTVEGFAPTSRAARQLRESGISADTLQRFLTRGTQSNAEPRARHLYMIDESSLASTKQVREFLAKLESGDRVLFVGDTRQHQGVEAGKPFEQLVEAGMKTVRLDQIVRQQNPELKAAVEHLARGEMATGIELLQRQGAFGRLPIQQNASRRLPKSMLQIPRRR